ncbi:MAG: hypothetical protein B9S37_01850 [Verrucomicrobiia bacterium Tous-C3TDCM]|nr:MAG: hypothetical protein B9S37_01850 [Verrucomicrobiae bacterium Tous-C3TDCM]PAZ06668.1 MAG: hypothetical protein CAK88_04090 [Verrucomicrobiae bacterium AMD-G2]
MKFFFAILGIFGAGVLGYVLEPDMRYSLTGMAPIAEAVTPKPVATTTTAPTTTTPAPAPTAPTYDYSKLVPNQLPEKVLLKVQATATAEGESDALALPAGTKVTPVRIEGAELVFSILGTAQGKVAVAQTNLIEQLIANPPPPPVVEPEPAPEPVVAKKNPEPMPEPEPEAKPEPEPAPAAGATLSPDDIVKLMQESVRSAQIKEFTFDQVTGWKAGEEEEVDGSKFQTGLAAYKAETIFGVKNIQAKALIQEGKVIRWIWPTSGLEIQ